MTICKNCGTKNPPKTRVCKKCKVILSSKNKIPSTLISKNQRKQIPDTIVGMTNKPKRNIVKKDIPNTVIASKKNKEVPPTLLIKTDVNKNNNVLQNNKKEDIFTKYNDIVTPIFEEKELQNQDIIFCPHCGVENAPFRKNCQVCAKQLKLEKVDRIVRFDIDEKETYPISQKNCIIGREIGDILFPQSKHISQKHTKIYYHQDKIVLSDLGSMNGTYLKLRKPYLLNDGDIFNIGKQIFQFRLIPKIEKSIVPNRKTDAFFLSNAVPKAKIVYFIEQGGYDIAILQTKIVFGRETGNFTFNNDGALSPQHASISFCSNGYILKDLDSKSGTWIRITKPSILKHGDMFRVGEHTFILKRS